MTIQVAMNHCCVEMISMQLTLDHCRLAMMKMQVATMIIQPEMI